MPRLPSLVAIAFLILPSPAVAQTDDGVHIEPDSPAGKQYAIPLEEARSEGAGEPGGAPGGVPPRGNPASAASGSEAAPLFGEGIRRAVRPGGGEPSPGPLPAARSAASTDPGTVPLWAVALGLALLGGGLGLALRRAV
jgi:hypothetical protein